MIPAMQVRKVAIAERTLEPSRPVAHAQG
jgi:hypothetical protein